ncbi:MAG: PaaR repeat-containing protein [Candidatus Thiodiazotropha taylori]|uniref:PaaR repeat-containing protein n=1 Tax=Candidatus Thiodiazotropha taylori TaxID=2792791 RepID=A0A9E4N3F6_9GAMM|nr:PaaR repeat-containing protein [Candidatus Thiodiazotropha taylori]MCW4254918.1 PaaR repeat-containing protein [Candidatus Thiodiazotropha taylori]
MEKIARIGDSIATGHGCDATSTIAGGSSNVFAEGVGVSRQGDAIAPHTIEAGDQCVPHTAVINSGSSTVFANGIPLARVDDSADAGKITSGASKTFSG